MNIYITQKKSQNKNDLNVGPLSFLLHYFFFTLLLQ